MSFEKARDLLRLADLAAGRHRGVTLEEVRVAFGVSHRTAQRMMRALEEVFPHAVETHQDGDGRRRWAMREQGLARMRLAGDRELAALDFAVVSLRRLAATEQADALASLRDRLLAAIPAPAARRAEADAEAILTAHGLAVRPGPAPRVAPDVVRAVTEALRGPFRLRFGYRGEARRVEPLGVLLGARPLLVALQPEKGPEIRQFRLDLIEGAEVTNEWFVRDESFDLDAYAARSFGSWQDGGEHGEVVWRFAPHAAERAAEWRFHPHQVTERLPDGSLEVRFYASGWLEMAWHLYSWGDAVEVVAPEALRLMVERHRRDDWGALP